MPDLTYLLDCDPKRFELTSKQDEPTTMKAVVTTGNGDYDKLAYCTVTIPQPRAGEVLIRVLAAGVNNTEINTRLGWYSSSVRQGTEQYSETKTSQEKEPKVDGGWNNKTPFPFIQGTDCCGKVVKLGQDVSDQTLMDKRVLVRPCMRLHGFASMENIWMASDFDGAFAQFVRVPACEVFPIDCNWTNVELATIPCAYGTAENMVHRAQIGKHDRVLVTGASGGVGSAVVQLAKRRGAHVTAIVGRSKMEHARTLLEADEIIPRDLNVLKALGESAVDVVIDNVAGDCFENMLKILKRGGRYASSGAIAGPMVKMDMRDFYLKDINLIGCTAWDEPVFRNLIRYIEEGEIKPLVARTYELKHIAKAQQDFMEKTHIGKFVLVPPEDT